MSDLATPPATPDAEKERPSYWVPTLDELVDDFRRASVAVALAKAEKERAEDALIALMKKKKLHSVPLPEGRSLNLCLKGSSTRIDYRAFVHSVEARLSRTLTESLLRSCWTPSPGRDTIRPPRLWAKMAAGLIVPDDQKE